MKILGGLFGNMKEHPEAQNLPVLFIGHGNPLNAIRDNEFTRNWISIARTIPKPKAILSVSSQWTTEGETRTTLSPKPETRHDFNGFSDELKMISYPAPGAVDLARYTIQLVKQTDILADHEAGFDHGTWSVLLKMFPEADIPVYQISIDSSRPMDFHYNLGKELAVLRKKGVLIMGTGNIVYNSNMLLEDEEPHPWALEFDYRIAAAIKRRLDPHVIHYHKFGQIAKLSQPNPQHLMPLLYTLAACKKTDKIEFFNDRFDQSAISMRSFIARH